MDLTTLNAAQGYANDKQKSTAAECTSKGDYYFENGVMKIWNGSAFVTIGADVAAQWGMVGGTLSAQTDLQNALDSKLSAVPPATTSTLGGVIVGNGLSVNASGTVSVAEKPLETEFSYRLDSPAKQVVVAEANASMGNILSTDTTIASKIVNNVPLSNNMSMSLLIPASMKQEIINEVNAGVLVTIYTILDTDTTLARRIINSAPLSSGTFNLTEVNNG